MSLTRFVYAQNGDLLMIVKPDNDEQLADPAFSPKNSISVDISKTDYAACKTQQDFADLIQASASTKDPTAALLIAAKAKAKDDTLLAEVELNAVKIWGPP